MVQAGFLTLMRRRTNPWPALVELFSALLTATFAGFIMMTSAYQQELSGFQKREHERKEFQNHAQQLKQRIQNALSSNKSLNAKPRSCGDDTCIDLYFHFSLNEDTLESPEERENLTQACRDIKTAFDTLAAEDRRDLGIVIEGHTDSSQAKASVSDSRSRERFNWDLSARRATSVLYEFRQCGLKSPDYKIEATGHSDTSPVPGCETPSKECDEKNRRTTLRLRADTARIEQRLKGQTEP